MTNLINDKDLNKLISSAIKSGATFAVALHKAAQGCLERVDANGDVRFLNKLAAGLTPRALEALAVWSVKYGKVKYVRENKGFKVIKRDLDAVTVADRAAIGPMDVVRSQKPREKHVFNLRAELEKLIERATKVEITGKPIELMRQAMLVA